MNPHSIRARCALLALALVAVVFAAPAAAEPFEAAVWNGTVVAEDTHRAVGRLDVYGSGCSGTLIRPRWVLTAAHCLSQTPAAPVIIGLGGVRVRNGFDEVHATRLHVVHPNWSFASGRNDFGLVYLRERSNIPRMELHTGGPENLSVPDAPVEIVGWGAVDGYGTGADTLRHGFTNIASDGLCGSLYRGYDNVTMMCAHAQEADACAGDSGGPLLATAQDATTVQLGVTSFGAPCDDSEAGVYARVTAGLAWIDKTIAGGRPARLPTRFIIQSAPTQIREGGTVTIKARLARAPGTRGLVHQPVQLLRRRAGTTDWRVVSARRTFHRGAVIFTDTPSRDVVYKLRHRRTSATKPTATDGFRINVAR